MASIERMLLLEEIRALPKMEKVADGVLNLFVRRAITNIRYYLNKDSLTNEEVEESYPDAIISLVLNDYSSSEFVDAEDGSDGKDVKSITQGSRAITYFDKKGSSSNSSGGNLTSDARRLLPLPYMKLR